MATKEAYQKKLEAQLKEWDAKLDQLSAKAQKATADARITYENDLESLKSKRAAAHQTLVDLGKRSENAWEDMKDGAEKIWDELSKAMEKLAARFK
jgi:chromosome segregation ATPase